MNKNELLDQFKEDCRVVSMANEYPGYVGEIKWIIFSSLAEEELAARYASVIVSFKPYLYMSMDQYAPVREFNNNDRKHRRRSEETYDVFGFVDGEAEMHHPELAYEDAVGEYDDLYSALEKLSPKQRDRIVKRFFEGKTLCEIAEEEGQSFQAISKSTACALKTLKKLLEQG